VNMIVNCFLGDDQGQGKPTQTMTFSLPVISATSIKVNFFPEMSKTDIVLEVPNKVYF